jgi:hypothetical protein
MSENTKAAVAERPLRQCEACAEGRPCERLQALTEAAWRQGELK